MKELQVPDFPNYYADEEGNIISYARTGIRKVKSPKRVSRENRKPRHQVVLHHEGKSRTALVSRIVMAAVLGRWPESWEQVRHMDQNPSNNAPSNLKIGCPVLNAIDDIENGTRQTSPEYINQAIQRLEALKALL